MIDAIRDGDVAAVRRYLYSLPHEELWQDGGRALAGEVARSGGPGFAQLFYGYGGALPSGPWGEIDPPVWAADHGVSVLLKPLLQDYPAPEATLRRALDAAQAWLDVDPEAELRRRAGLADGDAFTVARDHITIDEYEPRARRIRLSAADGRWVEVLAEHRAVVTVLEQYLDLSVSRDELLTRALWSADPESCTWSESQHAVRARFPAEGTFLWAAARLADEDVAVRRFTAELLHMSTVDGEAADTSYAADARAALWARMAAETDTETLCSVLGAYAGFSELHPTLHELLPFTADRRPEVRRRAALHLFDYAGADDRRGPILETMLRLARDPDPTVRATATATLIHSTIDTPALRELLAAQLDGDDRASQIAAAVGLALRWDAHALVRLRQMSDEDGYESHAWNELDRVERVLAQRPGPEPSHKNQA
ncbi:hypothetical protein [Dactylosporangium fulvum]|uniref:HEAT repeat domain-containing protein n=1 Tax=Dactylosporangium fulvum TaxID=53359 RepID=A0ABY5W975_9ACTN|nr:hypothetical protein [Dactylosporangium fulvum]UWP86633.1 hypothetical protein Dfulv_21285 [Dactylosporangium fulvum]